MAVAVRKSIGNPGNGDWSSVYVAMETLGSDVIRTVGSANSYAFIAVKGETATGRT